MSQTIAARCFVSLIVGLTFMHGGDGQSATPSSSTPVNVKLWTPTDLNLQAKDLMAQAAKNKGSAGETLTKLPNQYTMLTTRTSSGGAELHGRWCDYLIVLDGEGVELTGGSIIDRHEEADGEIRGTRLEGAESHSLHKGDIIFIPAGTPHQAIEARGQSLTLFVIKSAAPAQANP